jgi:hypothetical protein
MHQVPEEIADELVGATGGLALSGVQLGRISQDQHRHNALSTTPTRPSISSGSSGTNSSSASAMMSSRSLIVLEIVD